MESDRPFPVRFGDGPERMGRRPHDLGRSRQRRSGLLSACNRYLDQSVTVARAVPAWARGPLDAPIGGSVADAAWTGTSVVIVTDGEAVEDGAIEPAAAAVFDFARRAWCEIPRPPVTGRIDLVWTGAELLALGSPWPADGPMEMSRFDLASDTWSTATGTPLEGGSGGIPLGGALLFLGGPPDDGLAWDAWYDPAADSWHPIDTECPVRTSGSIWTGTLVVGEEYAYEPTTGACFTVPLPPGGALRGSTVV